MGMVKSQGVLGMCGGEGKVTMGREGQAMCKRKGPVQTGMRGNRIKMVVHGRGSVV